MPREIKFRSWGSKNKIMSDPFTLQGVAEWRNNVAARPVDTSKIIYLQFTGLHDKNGKEIYEGDILRVSEFVTKLHLTHVVWDTDLACWHRAADYGFGEVIGNIYENPQLLKVDQP